MITNPGEISLEDSLKICQESIKKAREQHFMPITVTVIDVAGVIRATLAENGSASIRADIAFAKAWSCIQAGMSTTLLRDVIEEQPRLIHAFRGMQMIADGKLIPTPGGLLIQKNGKNIGAIGVSGDRSDEDDICAVYAIETSGFTVGHKAI